MWRRLGTKSIASAAVLLLAVSGSAAVAAAPAGPGGTTKKADLVTKTVTGALTGRSLAVSATVTNKAGKANGKKAKKSSVVFVLSTDATIGESDKELGMLPVGKLLPKKSATVSGTFTVPTSVPAGTYYVVACADALGKVKEKKETNNCAAGSTVTVAPTPPTATVTVSYQTAPGGGTVAGTATNGTCVANAGNTQGVCTVSSGVGSVTITATSAGPSFTSWQDGGAGAPCDGAKSGATVTFTAPTANKSCNALFGA
jgi:hypothetical protein